MITPRTLPVILVALAGALAEAGARPRVVYFSQNVGGGHDAVPLGRDILARLGTEKGGFDLDECTDCTRWSERYFARCAAMVSFGSGGLPLSQANREAFIGFVRGGGGFVAVHAGLRFLPRADWPEFAELIGADPRRVRTGWHQRVRVNVEDRVHPATVHLGAWFRLSDEIYTFSRWSRERTHVLLSIDNRSVDPFRVTRKPEEQDFPVSWCHPYGKGRVFYTSLGHEAATWHDPRFQLHLLNGILWAMGRLQAKVPLGFDGRIREVKAPHPRALSLEAARPHHHAPESTVPAPAGGGRAPGQKLALPFAERAGAPASPAPAGGGSM